MSRGSISPQLMPCGSSGVVAQTPSSSLGPREASLSTARAASRTNRPDMRLEALPSDWQLPTSDIDACLSFSRVRCLMSLVSLCLLVTDIPRTGLGIEDVYQLFPSRAGPSMAVYFGPWAYPVAHIWQHMADVNGTQSNSTGDPKSSSSSGAVFGGKKGSSAITSTRLWSYEFDSTSIGMRGITELLNVSAVASEESGLLRPKSRRDSNPNALLKLKTTFRELDTLVAAIQRHLAAQTRDDNAHALRQGFFAFATQHFWIDRLHHYLYRFTGANTRWRLNSVHTYEKESVDPLEPLDICSAADRRRRPLFCGMPVVWMCSHPANASSPKVPIWDHVDLRVAAVQRKYPALALDLTIFTTYNPTTSATGAFSAFFETEVFEIVMIIRGRNCSTSASASQPEDACETVFVDDYRYERGVIESNIAEWYVFTASLRTLAQFYVWVRLVLLFYVAYTASAHDPPPSQSTGQSQQQQQTQTQMQQMQSQVSRVASTVRTMSKIPFQVVVYGSLFPVLSYVLAHVIDCSFVDLFLESYWTTVNGTSTFDLRTFVRHASVQMRNVWILALFMKLVVFFQTRVMLWKPHTGVHGVRGLAISLSSMLSVFGPYRSLSFRSCAIITVFALSDSTSDRGALATERVKARPVSLFNVSMEGLPKDLKMTLFAVCAVIVIALVVRLLLTLSRPGYLGGILFGSSTIVPYSAGILWPTTALSIRFQVSLATPLDASSSNTIRATRIVPAASVATADASSHRVSQTAKRSTRQPQHQALIHPVLRFLWTNAVFACYSALGIDSSAEKMFAQEGLSLHDHALRFEERTVEINSIVRLMNIAMMTDPWTLFRLRVLGAEVFFYESTALVRERQRSDPSRRRWCSGSINTITGEPHHIFLLPCSPEKMLEWTGCGKDEYRLVGHMSSRELPWSVLLQCG